MYPDFAQKDFTPSLVTELDAAIDFYLEEYPSILSAKDTLLVRQAFEAGWFAKESNGNGKEDDGHVVRMFSFVVVIATICLGYFIVEWLKTI